jgi:hypothetical protein
VYKALANAFIGQLKDGVLSVIQDDLWFIFLLQRFLRDLICRAD